MWSACGHRENTYSEVVWWTVLMPTSSFKFNSCFVFIFCWLVVVVIVVLLQMLVYTHTHSMHMEVHIGVDFVLTFCLILCRVACSLLCPLGSLGHELPRILCSLILPYGCWDYICGLLCFLWVLGIRTQVLMLAQQDPCLQSTFIVLFKYRVSLHLLLTFLFIIVSEEVDFTAIINPWSPFNFNSFNFYSMYFKIGLLANHVFRPICLISLQC